MTTLTQSTPARQKTARSLSRLIAAVGAVALLTFSLSGWAGDKHAKKATSTSADETAKTTEGETPAAKADTVHITIQTVPPRKAQVKWGRKFIGPIPAPRALVVERPRDSGPMDLVIHATGFLPVHTRAYTFSDSRVAVKLTPPAEKNTLFGYREEPAPNPDAGAPAPASPAPASSAPAPAPSSEPPKP